MGRMEDLLYRASFSLVSVKSKLTTWLQHDYNKKHFKFSILKDYEQSNFDYKKKISYIFKITIGLPRIHRQAKIKDTNQGRGWAVRIFYFLCWFLCHHHKVFEINHDSVALKQNHRVVFRYLIV